MAVELDHSFTTTRSIDDSYATILDLERTVPCVEGGTVIEKTGPESVKAEIKVKMGAMGLKFTGTVEITEKDPAAHRVVLAVKSREAGGRVTRTPPSPSACARAGATSTPTRRSPAPQRRWARASWWACSTR